jgi:hypothetical protein
MSHHHLDSTLRPQHLGMLLLLAGLVAGCQDATSPTAAVPSGGQQYVLDYETFATEISPVLSQHGCNAEGDCHGGGIRGSLELRPESSPDPGLDFEQVCLQVRGEEPASSPILLKPLDPAAGGSPHAISAFASTGDADYQKILAWIEAGHF